MKKILLVLSLLIFGLFIILAGFKSNIKPDAYPKIIPLKKTIVFDEKHKQYSLPIFAQNGKILYKLDVKCPAGEYEEKKGEGYYYSGWVDFRLYSVDNPIGSLLQNKKNATRDWQTDGRFLGVDSEVLAENPGRCIIQNSKVYGMDITLKLYYLNDSDNLHIDISINYNHNIKSNISYHGKWSDDDQSKGKKHQGKAL